MAELAMPTALVGHVELSCGACEACRINNYHHNFPSMYLSPALVVLVVPAEVVEGGARGFVELVELVVLADMAELAMPTALVGHVELSCGACEACRINYCPER